MSRKDKFDACGIGQGGDKVFSFSCSMDKKGFEKLTVPLRGKAIGTSRPGIHTACYHITLFSYLTARGYRVIIINPLLISNFVKLQLKNRAPTPRKK